MGILYYFIALGWNAFAWFLDFDESRRKVWYGKSEGNALYRGKDGQMIAWKAVAVFLVLEAGVGIALSLLIPYLKGDGQSDDIGYYAMLCWCGAIGLLHFLIARKNIARSKTQRVKQRAERERLKNFTDLPVEILADDLKFVKAIEKRNGFYYHELFPWILGTDRIDLAYEILDWARLPEDDQLIIWGDLKYDV